MKRLLSIELQKIWKNTASRILIISYFILICLISIFASINFDIGSFKLHLAGMGIFNFPYIWHFNSWIASLLKIFLAVIIVSMMANEYSYGTFKQNLIDGLNKKEFILSKFLTIVIFSFLSTVLVFIISIILGLTFSSYDEMSIIFSDLEYLVGYFFNLVGFFSACLFLGILVKRSAFALGFLMILYVVDVFITNYVKFNVYKDSDYGRMYTQFLPFESFSSLLIEPISRLKGLKSIGSQAGIEFVKDYDVHLTTVIIVLIWTFIFIFLSYKIIQKRDL